MYQFKLVIEYLFNQFIFWKSPFSTTFFVSCVHVKVNKKNAIPFSILLFDYKQRSVSSVDHKLDADSKPMFPAIAEELQHSPGHIC